jgi:hypothetical protein
VAIALRQLALCLAESCRKHAAEFATVLATFEIDASSVVAVISDGTRMITCFENRSLNERRISKKLQPLSKMRPTQAGVCQRHHGLGSMQLHWVLRLENEHSSFL